MLSKFFLFLRHAIALVRADKLFSAIYIAGTAVAIASAMVIAIVMNILLADIAPEVNRSRTLYAEGYIMTDSTRDAGVPTLPGFSEVAIDSCFKKMQCVEAAAGITHFRHEICNEKKENKINQFIIGCDPDLYRLYNFTFIQGRPFSKKEFRDGERVCVINESLARKLGNPDRIVFPELENSPAYRVVGVIKTVSAMAMFAAAEVFIPYTTKDIHMFGKKKPDMSIDYAGTLELRILLRKGYSRNDFLSELEPLRQHYNALASSKLCQHAEWVVNADTHFFKIIQFYEKGDQGLGRKALHLMPFGLIMLLFLFLPAINLSGLVANRMEARRPEMGIRKAFGAKRHTLLREVIFENLVLTLCGGVVGWLVSWLFIYVSRNNDIFVSIFDKGWNDSFNMELNYQMFFTPTLFIVCFLCCAVLNLMAALIPSWRSLRKPIVESLNQKR